MKHLVLAISLVLISVTFNTINAQKATAVQTSLRSALGEEMKESLMDDCRRIITVQSPSADTYTSFRADSINFGSEISMMLRGVPEKRAMLSHLNFVVSDIEQQHVSNCILKVYTVSKKVDSKLLLYGMTEPINEETTAWQDQPTIEALLSTKPVGSQPFVEFDVTTFVKDHLGHGMVNFCLRTDSKKPIAISSRESGLGSELIIDHCDYGPYPTVKQSNTISQGEYGMNVLPSKQNGKFIIELLGVPAGGFGDLMIMDEGGSIIRQLPMAIRDGDVLQHTLDYGPLMPGLYWAVFRKGRVLVRDQFRLRPSPEADKLLEIAIDLDEEVSKGR